MLLSLGGLLNFQFAHEVYVLSPEQIQQDRRSHIVRVFDALHTHHNFRALIVFAVAAVLVLAFCLFLKSRKWFQKLGAFIDKGSVLAPDFIRVIFGASLIFSATHNALFGPELPLSSFPGATLLKILLLISGAALILGVVTRTFGLLALFIYFFAFVSKGWYMLTYTNYLGEALAIVLIPLQAFSLDALWLKTRGKKAKRAIFSNAEAAMPVARILFGFSLLYAALNIKFLTPSLSLDVVNRYGLDRFFHLDPLMLVLVAGMVELLTALLYMAGLLQRFNTVVFVAFIIASLIFFKESVWPHYLLLGLGIGIFMHRPDVLALDKYLFPGRQKQHKR